jgi:hypothetical protein
VCIHPVIPLLFSIIWLFIFVLCIQVIIIEILYWNVIYNCILPQVPEEFQIFVLLLLMERLPLKWHNSQFICHVVSEIPFNVRCWKFVSVGILKLWNFWWGCFFCKKVMISFFKIKATILCAENYKRCTITVPPLPNHMKVSFCYGSSPPVYLLPWVAVV